VGDALGECSKRFRSLGLNGSPRSASEVVRLQNDSGLPLPAAYGAYLLIAGKSLLQLGADGPAMQSGRFAVSPEIPIS
jgi:hypothetical protein